MKNKTGRERERERVGDNKTEREIARESKTYKNRDRG